MRTYKNFLFETKTSGGCDFPFALLRREISFRDIDQANARAKRNIILRQNVENKTSSLYILL